jgi:membrane associated rhomboid family serine protease
MVLPLYDHLPRRITPVVNYLLIAASVLMFLWELSLGPDIERDLYLLSFVPARFWMAPLNPVNLIRILISMFLHGGWLHLGGNMLYLWIFGDNIEDRLGHFKYLIFYLLCGFIATLTHAVFNADSPLPSIGASGAIAGVLGAYILLFPRARVTTLIPIFVFITVREVPAFIVLGLWFVLQLFTGVASVGLPEGQTGGVAYFAHIGGFVAGMLLVVLMGGYRRPAPPPQAYSDYWR